MLNEHELGFLRFLKDRQGRRVEALLERGASGRDKLREIFPHGIELNPKYFTRIASDRQKPELIVQELLACGATEKCHVMSEDSDIDGQYMLLRNVFADMRFDGFGMFVSCIPGILGYYQFEDAGERYLLRRE